LWGTQARLQYLFSDNVSSIRTINRDFIFRYRSPQHWLEVFRSYYGPMNKTYAALDAAQQDSLTRDLMELITRHNRPGDETLVLPSAYLEVVIQK
jgi:uridine kinase